jgi:hypothetical protein
MGIQTPLNFLHYNMAIQIGFGFTAQYIILVAVYILKHGIYFWSKQFNFWSKEFNVRSGYIYEKVIILRFICSEHFRITCFKKHLNRESICEENLHLQFLIAGCN